MKYMALCWNNVEKERKKLSGFVYFCVQSLLLLKVHYCKKWSDKRKEKWISKFFYLPCSWCSTWRMYQDFHADTRRTLVIPMLTRRNAERKRSTFSKNVRELHMPGGWMGRTWVFRWSKWTESSSSVSSARLYLAILPEKTKEKTKEKWDSHGIFLYMSYAFVHLIT